MTKIAAQLYTIRDFTKTPRDIAASLKKIKQLGYGAVQLSALGPIEPEELKRILDGEGLIVCVTHTPYERICNEMDKVIYEHHLWGAKYIAIGSMPSEYRNAQGFSKFAEEASEVARKLKANGFTFGYHNHSFELEKFGNHTGLDILYEKSDPEVFTAEIDTYWIQHGGGDPASWIRKLKGRVPLVHLKDMGIFEGKQMMTEVGEGNLNWQEILKACNEADVKWYIIEQDICQRDPFESLGISLRNLKTIMGGNG